MKRAIILAALSLMLLSTGLSEAGDEGAIALTLKGAIEISLRENLTLAEENILRDTAGAEVTAREGEFDPKAGMELSSSYKKEDTVSPLMSSEERSSGYGLSIGGKAKTGTGYELKWSGGRVKRSEALFQVINPYYFSELKLSLTQPLLKGFGKSVQESSLRAARRGSEAARLNAEFRAGEVVMETASAYWNFYYAISSYDVSVLSLNLSEKLLEEVNAKVEAGVLPPVETFRAVAEVAMRKEDLLRAKKALYDAEDKLRAVMNLGDWQRPLLLVESPHEPAWKGPDFGPALDAALEKRGDYRALMEEHKGKTIMRKFYENQRLPALDMTASSGLSGLESSHGDAIDEMASGDFYSWQVGLMLTVPLGNRAAKGTYLKARLEEKRVEIRLAALRQKITMELREAIRGLQLSGESFSAAKAARLASQSMLEAEQARFGLGMATLNDVIGAQEEFSLALAGEKRALADCAISLVSLERATGTLIETYGDLFKSR